MKILMIEDTPRKADCIKNVLEQNFPLIEIVSETSYHTALENIEEHGLEYDVILLDMSMNTYNVSVEEDGGVPEPFAGIRILEKLYLAEIQTKVKVISAYQKIEGRDFSKIGKELEEQYPNLYDGFIFFDFNRKDWKIKLTDYLNSLL